MNERGRGRFLTFLAGIRIRVNNQTIDGRVYDFEASHQGDGVWRIDRIAGSTESPSADTSPDFGTASGPGDQTYTAGTAIGALTLPAASGGDGDLTYGLSPEVPGLSFDGATRHLTGTPSTPGTYAMTYTATDSGGDTGSLAFTITVSAAATVALGDCQVGLTVETGESCTYPETDDAFTVDGQGRGSFLFSQSEYGDRDRQPDDRWAGLRPGRLAPGQRRLAHRSGGRQHGTAHRRWGHRYRAGTVSWRAGGTGRPLLGLRQRRLSLPSVGGSADRRGDRQDLQPVHRRVFRHDAETPISSISSPARRRTTAACARRAPTRSGPSRGTCST